MSDAQKEKAKAKIIIKRPWVHYAIITAYILAPFVNIGLVMLVGRVPVSSVVARYFKGFGYLSGIWLLTAPIVGMGLYFVHKVSWYLFLAHSSLILIDYVLKWVQRPMFYWRAVPWLSQILILTGNVVLVLIIGYIIRRDFRSPYFQVFRRGWRTTKRVPIRYHVFLDGERRFISDLSIEGCFVAESDLGLKAGQKLPVRFEADRLTVECTGQVMRITPNGYGIRFLRLSLKEKMDIRRMLKTRYAWRYPVEMTGVWKADGRRLDANVVDLSFSGCYLEADVSGVSEGGEGELTLASRPFNRRFAGSVVWVNTQGEHGKPNGFGLHFSRCRHGLVKRLVARHGTQSGSAARA